MILIKEVFQNIFTFLRPLRGLWLGVVALILRYATPPQYIESFYSRNIFLWVRRLFDFTLAFAPFALLWVFYVVAFYFVVKIVVLLFNKKKPLRQRFTEGVARLLNFVGFMLFGFFILWGFNYGRPNFAKQIGLKIEKMDTTALRQELFIAAQEAIAARDSLMKPLHFGTITDSDTTHAFAITHHFESDMRSNTTQFLNKYNFPAGGHLRGRQIQPDGLLFRFGIAGIYMPYIGEASIDNALHPLEKPFSMAHEMAHAYGWTEEATANFVAYLACRQSDDLFIRYSGYLSYYRYVASNFKRQLPDEYKKFRETLPTGIKNDLTAINQRIERYPNWFDTSGLNDLYLKSQGVTEGVDSYARIVVLVYSWRKKM
jgi:Protein of unknown function (DUF3810)